MLPESVITDLLAQRAMIRQLHDADLAADFGSVWLLYAFARKALKSPFSDQRLISDILAGLIAITSTQNGMRKSRNVSLIF